MKALLFLLVLGILLLLVWLIADLSEKSAEHDAVKLPNGWPTYVGEPPPDTTTSSTMARARSKPIRAASAAPAVVAGSVNGYPCGGDLPPCYVLARESGGNPTAQNPRSTASGLWQFLDSTWANFKGYAKARLAPVDVQNERARQLWAGGRGCAHWSACG